MGKTTSSQSIPPFDADVDSESLARVCRALIRNDYPRVTSCIETSYLFERTAFYLGLSVTRVVCRAGAYSPLLAKAIGEGKTPKECMEFDDHWSVMVGYNQSPEDYLGRIDNERNRFVGHLVCVADNVLVDASADQMSRPTKGMPITGPVLTRIKTGNVVIAETHDGVVVRYELHPEVAVPMPKSDRRLDRRAKALAAQIRTGELKL